MTLPGRRFTYEEYRRLPDDERYELVAGELQSTPAPSGHHQSIQALLLIHLGSFVLEHHMGKLLGGPTDVILSDETVLHPDLLFIARERRSIYDRERGVVGAPDLVIEILSPSTLERDLVIKRQLYGEHGVREYWIVDPEAESIEVLTHQGTGLETWQRFLLDGTLTSPLHPGLRLNVTAVFED
jgi:Uma2 family endonuclease